MQTEIALCEPAIATDEMPFDNRFDGLDRRVGKIEDQLFAVEKRLPPADFPFDKLAAMTVPKRDNWLRRNTYWIGPALAGVALLFGSGPGIKMAALWLDKHIDTKLGAPIRRLGTAEEGISAATSKLDGLINRLDRIESKVDAFYGEAMKRLLQRSAIDSIPDAKAKMTVVNAVLQNATQQKIQASNVFFKDQISILNQIKNRPELEAEARAITFSLAAYRSSLQSSYVIPEDAVELAHGADRPNDLRIYKTPDGWGIWDFSKRDPARIGEEDLVSFNELPGVPPQPLKPPWIPKMYITKQILIGGTQTLDGSIWQQVIFSEVRIHYRGGRIILDGVKFMNCTFDFSPTTHSDAIATLIALASPGLKEID